MKKQLILILVLLTNVAFGQCIDTCSYTINYMHNADSSKHALFQYHKQGMRLETANDSTQTAGVFQVDSYNGTIELGSYNLLTSEQSVIHLDKFYGIQLLSALLINLESQKITMNTDNEVSVKSGNATISFSHNNSNKLIIKSTSLPTSCTGLASGTWYNSSGSIKICP